MDLFLNNILISLIVSLILIALGVIFKPLPPYIIRKITYKGQDISGEWISNFEWERIKINERILIRQSGIKISGSINTTKILPDNSKRTLNSKIIGEIRNNYLIAFYIPNSKRKFGCGTFTMELVEGGRKLKGMSVFQFSQDSSLQYMSQYYWERPA